MKQVTKCRYVPNVRRFDGYARSKTNDGTAIYRKYFP
jgi:hypothetical protein